MQAGAYPRGFFLSLALAIVVAGVAATVRADYERGRRAANEGNFAEAKRQWEPLAQQGNTEAQYSLGRMYARGDGVPKNFARAREYFVAAGSHGHGRACMLLGKMYEFGDGVNSNRQTAISWYARAVVNGENQGRGRLRAMGADAEGEIARARNVQVIAPVSTSTPLPEFTAFPEPTAEVVEDLPYSDDSWVVESPPVAAPTREVLVPVLPKFEIAAADPAPVPTAEAPPVAALPRSAPIADGPAPEATPLSGQAVYSIFQGMLGGSQATEN